MKIYTDTTRKKELDENQLNFKLGYLTEHNYKIEHEKEEAVEEEGHYEIVAEYENGGKDYEWKIDVPGKKEKPAYVETIEYKVFNKYSKEELQIQEKEAEIASCRAFLSETDFKAIKYGEGLYTEDEYKPIKEERQSKRDRITILQKEIEKLKKKSK